jgi:hypothetical protein
MTCESSTAYAKASEQHCNVQLAAVLECHVHMHMQAGREAGRQAGTVCVANISLADYSFNQCTLLAVCWCCFLNLCNTPTQHFSALDPQ